MMTPRERLKAYLHEKKISHREFIQNIGASQSFVSSFVRGFGDYAPKVREMYPDLNMGWVSTGVGSMLLRGDEIESSEDAVKQEASGRNSVTIEAEVWEIIRHQARSLETKDAQVSELIAIIRDLSQQKNNYPPKNNTL